MNDESRSSERSVHGATARRAVVGPCPPGSAAIPSAAGLASTSLRAERAATARRLDRASAPHTPQLASTPRASDRALAPHAPQLASRGRPPWRATRALGVGLVALGFTLSSVSIDALLGRERGARTPMSLRALLGTPVAHADIYEFVDAEGVAHYTNVPQGQKSWRKVAFEGRRSRVLKTPAEQRDRSPERYSRYDAHLLEAARLYQLPVALLRAVLHVESDFDPNVVSVDGAMGLMQLMPFTAQKMGVDDPFDPRQNILGGARFLRILANQWNGDLVKTVASYNAGAGAVERYRGVPPYGETRRYVNRVLERYYAYRAETNG
jgi:hypothetical protein